MPFVFEKFSEGYYRALKAELTKRKPCDTCRFVAHESDPYDTFTAWYDKALYVTCKKFGTNKKADFPSDFNYRPVDEIYRVGAEACPHYRPTIRVRIAAAVKALKQFSAL